jgi:hypothetical protein
MNSIRAKIQLSHITASLALIVVIFAIAYIERSAKSRKLQFHTIKLKLGPNQKGVPDIWDPPPIVKIRVDGSREILGETYSSKDLPKDMADWVILSPINYRGVSLVVDTDTPLQKVVDFLDQFKLVSDAVMHESNSRWGVPGKPASANLYFYSDTLHPILPLVPAPPVQIHEMPPPNPSFNSDAASASHRPR